MGSPQHLDTNMSNEEESLLRALKLRSSIVLPMLIKTAIELDLFEMMAKTPSAQFSSYDLASNIPTQTPQTPNSIERILRSLASHSILTSSLVTDERGNSKMLYGMTPLSNDFVRNQDGTSLASELLLFYDKVFVDCWYHLKDAVVEGGVPFEKAHGMKVVEYPAKDDRYNQVLNKYSYDAPRIITKLILKKYQGFEGVKKLVDVGGQRGTILQMIVSKYPNIKGTNFDLPHVIKDATPCPGVEHVGGDMFESVPKGDVFFMKSILHMWGDNDYIKLLKNCWMALPEYGKVVVMEMVTPDLEQDSISDDVSQDALCCDLIMWITNTSGKERMAKQYHALAKEAGFTSSKIVCRVATFWIMEFYKNT